MSQMSSEPGATISFILSGYATANDYETHEATWDGDREYEDESSAQDAGRHVVGVQRPSGSGRDHPPNRQ
jgi:hypothetical protein